MEEFTADKVREALSVIQLSCLYGDNAMAYYILTKYIVELENIIREHSGEVINENPDDIFLSNDDIITAITLLREVSVDTYYQESLMSVMEYVSVLQKIIDSFTEKEK